MEQVAQLDRQHRLSRRFSLVEVMVAVVIMSTSLASLIVGFSHNLANAGLAEDYCQANLLLRQRLTQLACAETWKTGKASGNCGEEFPRFQWHTEIRKLPGQPLWQLKATVIFERRGVTRETTVETVRIIPTTRSPGTSHDE